MILTCAEILEQARDPRAPSALQAGLDYLDEFASRIEDPVLRAGFLTDIPAHAVMGARRSDPPE